jgi:hypothetical protein
MWEKEHGAQQLYTEAAEGEGCEGDIGRSFPCPCFSASPAVTHQPDPGWNPAPVGFRTHSLQDTAISQWKEQGRSEMKG